jgi:hypothetical protein
MRMNIRNAIARLFSQNKAPVNPILSLFIQNISLPQRIGNY